MHHTRLLVATTLALLTLLVLISGCSKTTENNLSANLPSFWEDSIVNEYRQLGSDGYAALATGETDSAVALFTAQAELIPEGKYMHLHLSILTFQEQVIFLKNRI